MKTVWFWKGPHLSDRWAKVAAFSSDLHDKPSTVLSDIKPVDDAPDYEVEIDQDGNLVVHLYAEQFFGSPNMWYVLEKNYHPTDLYSIHGICSDAFPRGTVIPAEDIKDIKMSMDEYVGFIRWFKYDSRLQQIFVGRSWRRKRVSTCLIGVADIIIVSGDFGGYLNGGDITTEDGEKLRQAWSGSTRVTPRIGSVERYQ